MMKPTCYEVYNVLWYFASNNWWEQNVKISKSGFIFITQFPATIVKNV